MNKKLIMGLIILCGSIQADDDISTRPTMTILKQALKGLGRTADTEEEIASDALLMYKDLLACNDNTVKSGEQCLKGIENIKGLKNLYKEVSELTSGEPRSLWLYVNDCILRNLIKIKTQAELGQFK